MFGGQGLWEAGKALIKTSALGGVVVGHQRRAQAAGLRRRGRCRCRRWPRTFTDSAIMLFRVVAVTGLAIAIADYVVVRQQTMKKLKMSRYEIKQEHKQLRGRPAHEGAPPVDRPGDVAQPDDGRRRRGRRRCWSTPPTSPSR